MQCALRGDPSALVVGNSWLLGDIMTRFEKHIISFKVVKTILICIWSSDLGVFICPLGNSWSVIPIRSFEIDNYLRGLVSTSTHKCVVHT